MKLKDATEIQLGYQHRDSRTPISIASMGSHEIIQIKDLDLEGRFQEEMLRQRHTAPYVWTGSLYRLDPIGDPTRYQVDKGDVLFLCRAGRAQAASVYEVRGPTIASYYFFILRPNPNLLPQYLTWYINHPTAQTFLKSRMRGSNIKMIPRASFEQLEIPIPPLKIQESIIHLVYQNQLEACLMRKLSDNRQKLIDFSTFKAATASFASANGD